MTKPFYQDHGTHGSDICWRCVLSELFPDDEAETEVMCTHVRARQVSDVPCAAGVDYL